MAGELEIFETGLKQAIKGMARVAKESKAVMKRTHFRMGTLIKDAVQIDYAPKGVSQKIINRMRKASGLPTVTKRKARSVSRPKAGGLERSISLKHTPKMADIFVPVNSEAGAYAFILHEEKGNVWFERGEGTFIKGSKADDKYITRAIDDHNDDLLRIVKDEQNKGLKKSAARSGAKLKGII